MYDPNEGLAQAIGESMQRDATKKLERRVEELERQVQQLWQAVFPLG